MHVSFAEIFRAAPEILRMLGFPYGHADDAVECFVWTQAAFQQGYTLVQMTDELRDSSWPKPELRTNDVGTTVEMQGIPLLLYAARLSDLAVAEAARRGEGRVEAVGGFGGWIVPYVAHRLARAGLLALVRWDPPQQRSPAEAPGCIAVASPLRDAGTVELGIAPAGPFLAVPVKPFPLGAIEHEITSMARLLKSKPGSLSIVALPGPLGTDAATAAFEFAKRLGVEAETVGALDLEARIRETVVNGLELEEDAHMAMIKIAARIRLPSSERSRAQAG